MANRQRIDDLNQRIAEQDAQIVQQRDQLIRLEAMIQQLGICQQINHQPPPPVHQSRQLLAPFDGKDSRVSARGWITLLEQLMGDANDDQKYRIFVRHLTGEAQDWLCRQLRVFDKNPQWIMVRQHFLTNYAQSLVSPVVAASRLQFKIGDNVEEYFSKKNNLLDQANLEVQDKIGLLTEGFDSRLRQALIIATIDTLPDWLRKAKGLIDNYEITKSSNNTPSFSRSHPFKSNGNHSTPNSSTPNYRQNIKRENPARKPTSPCKTCLERGKTLYHWNSDCIFKASNPPNNHFNKPTVQHIHAPSGSDHNSNQHAYNSFNIPPNRNNCNDPHNPNNHQNYNNQNNNLQPNNNASKN